MDCCWWILLGGCCRVGFIWLIVLCGLYWVFCFWWVIVGGCFLDGRFLVGCSGWFFSGWVCCVLGRIFQNCFVWTYTDECIQARGGTPQAHVNIHKLAWTFHKLAGNLHRLAWKFTKLLDCTGSTCPPRGN